MRVVFATAEVSPIAKTGGLGDVCGSLPKELAKLGHDVVIFMPFYRQARQWLEENGASVQPVLPTVTIAWDGWSAEATFLRTTLPGTDIPVILVANTYFFERNQIYQSFGSDDLLLRYVFFCRALIRGCELLDITPDVLHCHDWHTALLPVYLHSGLRAQTQFANTRSVFTIHNLNYQGVTGAEAFALTGLHSRYWAPDALEHFGTFNPMKGGILFADQVTTVSPTYAREVQTPAYGAGLDGVLRAVSYNFHGILNGIDADDWDPATDALLTANYDADTIREKAKNKRALLREAGLTYSTSAKKPLITAVSRLVDQKGFQLLLPALERMLAAGAQVVILGSGEPHLEEGLSRIAALYPKRCRVWIGFDNALAHRIYAGGDMLMMPSLYEPCGLNQMYALRYGTIPIVRLTGGLVDTVIPFDGTNLETATGFGFLGPNPFDLYLATWLSMLNFKDAPVWKTIQANGMAADFSWDRSARKYDEVYQLAVEVGQ